MKTTENSLLFFLTVLFLLINTSLKTYAIDYTISFTGSGASSSVASVEVQNVTKGTFVTVPAGNVLNLNDMGTSTVQLVENSSAIQVYTNAVNGIITASFYAKRTGSTQIKVFNISGILILSETQNLTEGLNSVQLFLPNGTYILSVKGNGFSDNAKISCQSSSTINAKIIFSGNVNPDSNKQKSKNVNPVTQMLYNIGDQLLYKGISNTFSTIVADVPTGSKTVNFEFIACQDADGNNYSIVKIGTQTWMAENLRTTKYNDISTIPNITDNASWGALTTGAFCDHSNNTGNGAIYGHLYNWYAVNTGILAPTGWHVPTDAEWTTLVTFLGGDNVVGGKLKETGNTHWVSPNTGATNETGFGFLPGGGRTFDGIFPPNDVGYRGQCWTATGVDALPASYYRGIPNNNTMAVRAFYNKAAGFSVRCLK